MAPTEATLLPCLLPRIKRGFEVNENCEVTFCEDKQTSEMASNYGMCDGHYLGSLWDCERCLSDEGSWCRHKEKAETNQPNKKEGN
jgi:prepilin-type processing-associated H-X9-DG protein